jgi:hypothetical protein
MFILSFYEVALEDNILKKREIVLSVIQLQGAILAYIYGAC